MAARDEAVVEGGIGAQDVGGRRHDGGREGGGRSGACERKSVCGEGHMTWTIHRGMNGQMWPLV